MDQSSARAKLENASSHLDRLKDQLEAELAGLDRAASLGATCDPQTGRHTLYLETVPDMTRVALGLSAIVGDVVHNLRSALDHAAWQLASDHAPGGVPKRPLDFQFRLFRATSCTNKGEAVFGADAWKVVHEWQPCKGSNGRPDRWSGLYIHQAELLTRLNNDDKHKMLVELLFQASRFSYAATDAAGTEWEPRAVDDFVPKDDYRYRVGTPVAEIRAPAWPKEHLTEVGYAGPTLALADDGGRHAVSTLERLLLYVGDVLDDLSARCGHVSASVPGE